MRTKRAIFMSKVRNNSVPKIILGMCWDAHVRSLAIPRQAWKRIPSLAQNLQIFNTTSLQIKVIININFKQHIRLKSLVKGTQPKIHLSGKYLNSVNIVSVQ